MALRLKRETKWASPGADQQHYTIVFDDGTVRRAIGRLLKVGGAYGYATPWRWGIRRLPEAAADSGEAASLDDAMAACRRRWDQMTDEIKHSVVHSFGRDIE